MTYIIIGEAPAKDGTKKNLDVALACKAVCRMPRAGTIHWLDDHHPLLLKFVLNTIHVNLLDEWPGAAPKGGSQFPIDEGRERATMFVRGMAAPSVTSVDGSEFYTFGRHKLPQPDLIMLSGRRVASAFLIPSSADYFVTVLEHPKLAGLPTVVVPHPSRINRWWNDAENRTVARMFLEGLGSVAK